VGDPCGRIRYLLAETQVFHPLNKGSLSAAQRSRNLRAAKSGARPVGRERHSRQPRSRTWRLALYQNALFTR